VPGTDNKMLISRHRIPGFCRAFAFFTKRKYGGHFKRQTPIWQRNTPHNSYIARWTCRV